ncbi:MAG TPA: DNA methyltransferase, partial [Phycisphaerae bacterium]|nr:DNA methyltransferase [Phycisphaerae bacterium]
MPFDRISIGDVQLIRGDWLAVAPTLPERSVHCVVTSPPYFALRSYLPKDHPDKAKELGSEPTPEAFIATMVDVFREVRRVLRDDGVCLINLGDSYCSAQGGRQHTAGL